MKLVFVADNGFSEKNGEFYFNAPNYTHVKYLKKYFDKFVFVARESQYDKASFKINCEYDVHLVKKYFIWELIKTLEKVILESDAVICYGINGYFAYKIARKYNKTIIVYNGGDVYDFLISRGTIKGKLLAPIVRYLERKKFLNADYAHYCDEFLVNKYPTNGKVLVCSGVLLEINEINIKSRLSKIEDKDDSKVIIGLIGHTQNNLKGIGTAIKAIKELDGNFELQIVGKGEHEEYDQMAKELGIYEKVKFLGTKRAGDEIFTWLDYIDIYIQPSLIEGLPRATMEAMSRGCPVVSTNAGGLTHLIDKNFRVQFNDYRELAKKVKLLCNDKEVMKIQAKRNFEESKKYSPEIREKKYDDFYGKIT